ncbi:hypothetical protein GCM10010393_38190 [Streptomyces gobitricini]|uniref:Uncharacterized protein n=1 Tax=Streptomyces gobitricini TaxID=68211 RepID=A0ABN3MHQ8_9ACTN
MNRTLGKEAQAEGDGGDPDGHVDQEDGPPAEAEEVGPGQDTAQDGADDAAERHDGPVQTERLRPGARRR